VLLDFDVQPLMLGQTIVDGFGFTDVDLEPCPYHILTCMGGLEITRGLTKQKIVIKINPSKPTDTIVQA
jgi:hypothetical protein